MSRRGRILAVAILVASPMALGRAQDDFFDAPRAPTPTPNPNPTPNPMPIPAPVPTPSLSPIPSPSPSTTTSTTPITTPTSTPTTAPTTAPTAPVAPTNTMRQPVVGVTPDNPFGDPPPPPVVDSRPPPEPERVEALRRMEAEIDRIRESAGIYQGAVEGILNREYQRQRRVRTRWFTQRISQERRDLSRARDEAIAVFEAFVERYPFDATYTADAMFRLGELYFERSQERADAATAAIQAGSNDPTLSAEADYADTIRVYRTLVTRFPSYPRIDTALYLIGYASYYTGTDPNGRREARAAWLGITCPNVYPYRPGTFDSGPSSRDPLDLEVRAAASRAAEAADEPFAIDAVAPASDVPATPGFEDPFTRCAAMQSADDEGHIGESRHADEAWLRIGETYFDEEGIVNGRIGSWLAIRSYAHLLDDAEGSHFEGALYKTAWAYFKVAGYVQAVQHFARLLDRVEAVRARGGRLRAGAQLRPEALRFLALSLMYLDWDRMESTPDGQATLALARLRRFVPENVAWGAEAYFETGTILYEEQRYLDAVAIWKVALDRWPTNLRSPEFTEQMRLALHQLRDEAGEAETIDRLGRFGEGSDWWNANNAHPAEQIRAAELASTALLDSAFTHHETAQQRRAACTGDERADPGCHAAARVEYVAAVEAYREYLRQYPNDPRAYELHYSLADALFRTGDYATAAAEFEWVRDSVLDNVHQSEAGRGVVEAYRRVLDDAIAEGRITLRTEPPQVDASGRVTSVQIPELVLELSRARQTYNARVDESHDTESRRALYDYDNAMILYLYGYWTRAHDRLAQIFDERCVGPTANEWGREAWAALRSMAMATNDAPSVELLATTLRDRGCTFAPDGRVVEATRESCELPENRDSAQCQSLRDLNALQYREAIGIFRRAQETTGPEQRALYENAASMLVDAVDQHPEDPQAPQALELAAQALTATSRFESAGRLYERIVREVGARTSATPEERDQNLTIVANAIFQLAENAKQQFDFDVALTNYRLLADDARFTGSNVPRVQEFRRSAVTNAALLLERLRRYQESTTYYQRLVELSNDATVERSAQFEVARMSFESRDFRTASQQFRDFIRRYANDPAASAIVVEAYWNLAECTRNTTSDPVHQRTALEDVVTAYRSSGQQPGSAAAYFAAKAAFTLADADTQRVLAISVSLAATTNQADVVTNLGQAIATTRQTIIDPYVTKMVAVEAYRVPEFFIAARVAQARAFDRLAEATREALRNIDFRRVATETFRARFTTELTNRGVTGSAFRRTLDTLMQRVESEGQLDEAAFEMQSQLETAFDEALTAIGCDVVIRYVSAIRVATSMRIDNASTQYALNRLQTFGSEQIGQCIVGQQARDATFQPYSEGEFQRSTQRPGLDQAGSFPVPPLATEPR